MKLLYVDDKKTWHKLFEIVLSLRGVDVLHAYTLKEALNVAASEKPDLALVDVSISGASAYDLVPEILSLGVPVVVVGHRAEGFDKDRAISLGAYDTLEKPFTVEELLDVIRKAKKEAPKPEEKLELTVPSSEGEFELMGLESEPQENLEVIPIGAQGEEVPVVPIEDFQESVPVVPVELEESEKEEPSSKRPVEGTEEKAFEKPVSEEAREKVKRRAEEMSRVEIPEEKVEEIVREVAWEVIPEIAERVIREEIEKLIRSRLA